MESFADPENEVRKLQELVKKLEKQNELLRGKQNSLINGNNSPHQHDHDDDHHATHATDARKTDADDSNRVHGRSSPHSFSSKVSNVGLEDVDVLDIEHLSVKDEEDTWLYTSPKPLTAQESTINVYKWVRQDFDHPSPEVESARRSLLSKLDDAARINRSRSTPAFAKSASPGKSSLRRSTEGYSHREADSLKRRSGPHHRHSMPMAGSPLETMGSRIDNGTFIRRKERPRAVMAEKEQNEEGLYNVHEGTNVEKLARQQEESLRQSMSAYTSPKRVLHNKSMSIASDTDNSGSPGGSNRSSPRHLDYEGCRHRNSFGSDCSTPPDSPSVSHTHITHYPDQAHAGKNTSGVPRLQYRPQPSHLSNSSFEYQPVHGSDDAQLAYEARSSSHGPAKACHSASSAASGVRPGSANGQGPSLQRSGLPTPRRAGIPRPSVPSSVRSSVTGSVPRSGIPSPRPNSSAGRAGNWREGCF